ncbi:MAG: DUF1080 domain-containing protein [Armatimonadota bacterium]|nr:DUF1080 domain-containing protein [Armatimonadota bacterium]
MLRRKWRLVLLAMAAAWMCGALGMAQEVHNTLTEEEKAQGWRLLFDGKSLDGWRPTGKAAGWAVEDGTITCLNQGGGYLCTTEEFADFELRFEFRIAPRANSGVRLRSVNPNNPMTRGLEVQILDSAGRKPTRTSCGAIYDCVAPAKDVCRPAGEWNSMTILCRGSEIVVDHNGERIVQMDLDRWTTPNRNPDGTANKFPVAARDMPRKGCVAIQDHGGRIWLRNIKIRVLPR